jgi:hypothetical protein
MSINIRLASIYWLTFFGAPGMGENLVLRDESGASLAISRYKLLHLYSQFHNLQYLGKTNEQLVMLRFTLK